MWIDCSDRVLAASDADDGRQRKVPEDKSAMMFTRVAHVAPAMHKDTANTIRYKDEGVWAIVDDGCNSCTHSDVWRANAEEKWRAL